jgi:hypothetical protein
LSNREKYINAMTSMKVMEAKDLRKRFMQTIKAMVKKGMLQNNNMKKRLVIRRKDMKEIT